MKLQLVSHVVCPYVQRAVILLREKSAPHETSYVDLSNKPDWFLEISPRGKVPVLVVGDTPIFESGAICEYLDEAFPPPRLLPSDPLLRARDRGWFQFAEDVFGPVYRRMYATEQQAFDTAGRELLRALERLDREMKARDFLSGDGTRFGMADVAMAPAFTKMALMRELGAFSIPEELGGVRHWTERVLARESVAGSVPENYREESLASLRRKKALMVAHDSVK
jgi:glutathione S-transferase